MWTEATDEIKEFLAENKIKMYTTEYFREKGIKKWTIVTKSKKTKVFEQDFDFSFFEEKRICGCKKGIKMRCTTDLKAKVGEEKWCDD